MARPNYGIEPDITDCYICGDKVVIPPGVIYRGDKMHKHCARYHEGVDVTIDEIEPTLDGIEQDLQDALSNMGPMSEG